MSLVACIIISYMYNSGCEFDILNTEVHGGVDISDYVPGIGNWHKPPMEH